MALFGTKKTKKVVAEKPVKAVVSASPKGVTIAANDVILKPHVTEKAGLQHEASNVYTFQVAPRSTKHTIAHAIKAIYNVTPSKVRIVNLPMKQVVVRGKLGSQSAIKKALVYLKKGDKIEIA